MHYEIEGFIGWAKEKYLEENWNIEIKSKSWLKQVNIFRRNYLSLKMFSFSHRSMKRYFQRRKLECSLMKKNTFIQVRISY